MEEGELGSGGPEWTAQTSQQRGRAVPTTCKRPALVPGVLQLRSEVIKVINAA